MRSQGAIIFLARHIPLQAQKSAGGMFQQAGFPTVWLVPCRCLCWCRELLFPVGTDGHQSAVAPAMLLPPVASHGFVLDEPSCGSLSRRPGPCPSLGCGADPSVLTCPPLPLSPGAESFGLFSCMINGEEQEQTHRAVFR